MEETLKAFPEIPFDLKPKYFYLDGSYIVGVIEEEKFIGFVKWNGADLGYAEYKTYPRLANKV